MTKTKATLSQLAEQRFFEATGETWTGRGREWFARVVDPLATGRTIVERKARKLYPKLRATILAVKPEAPLDTRENEARRKLKHAFRSVEKFIKTSPRDAGHIFGGIVALVLQELAPLMIQDGALCLPVLPTIKELERKFKGQKWFMVMSGDEMRTRLAHVARGMPLAWTWARDPKVLACVSVLLGIRPTGGDRQRSRTPSDVLRLEEKGMRLALKRAVP